MAQIDRVLLVEADSISSQLLSFSLQREGFQVIQAQSGPDGLRMAREHQADIILSEVLLPDIDGYEMCRQLRADWNTQRIPILLVTSLGGTENRIHGLLAGADDFVTKPYDVRELVIRLRRLISTYSNCSQINAVTHLPGGQVIRTYVEEICLRGRARDWALLQIDLKHFRAFNQVYGFREGDGVLRVLGDLLREIVPPGCVGNTGNPCFIGHEGGDDFVAIVPLVQAGAVCDQLISTFDERIKACYPPEDSQKPYHLLVDRNGNTHMVPHLSLSIGVVTGDLCDGLSYLDVREIATAVTNRAKVEEGSASYVNRRRVATRPLDFNAPLAASG
jgi:DNA-binding response OmpR family regulator